MYKIALLVREHWEGIGFSVGFGSGTFHGTQSRDPYGFGTISVTVKANGV